MASSSSSASEIVVEAQTDGSETRGTFRWTINKYSSLPAAVKAKTWSAQFTLCGHEWRMELYPGGFDDDHKDQVALYVDYMSDTPKKL